MGKTTTNERSLKVLRRQGWIAEIVQVRIVRFGALPGEPSSISRDLAGFADVLAWHPGLKKTRFVQATTKAQMTNHIRKYRRNKKVAESILDWLSAGNTFQIWGFYQAQGKWAYVVKDVTPADLILTERDEQAMKKQGG